MDRYLCSADVKEHIKLPWPDVLPKTSDFLASNILSFLYISQKGFSSPGSSGEGSSGSSPPVQIIGVQTDCTELRGDLSLDSSSTRMQQATWQIPVQTEVKCLILNPDTWQLKHGPLTAAQSKCSDFSLFRNVKGLFTDFKWPLPCTFLGCPSQPMAL